MGCEGDNRPVSHPRNNVCDCTRSTALHSLVLTAAAAGSRATFPKVPVRLGSWGLPLPPLPEVPGVPAAKCWLQKPGCLREVTRVLLSRPGPGPSHGHISDLNSLCPGPGHIVWCCWSSLARTWWLQRGLGMLNPGRRGWGRSQLPSSLALQWVLQPHVSQPCHRPKAEPSCVALLAPRPIFTGLLQHGSPNWVWVQEAPPRGREAGKLSLSVHIPRLAQGVAQLGQGTVAPASSPVPPEPQTSAPLAPVRHPSLSDSCSDDPAPVYRGFSVCRDQLVVGTDPPSLQQAGTEPPAHPRPALAPGNTVVGKTDTGPVVISPPPRDRAR